MPTQPARAEFLRNSTGANHFRMARLEFVLAAELCPPVNTTILKAVNGYASIQKGNVHRASAKISFLCVAARVRLTINMFLDEYGIVRQYGIERRER